MARSGGTGPIGLRLTLAFVTVALAAVALITVLIAAFAAADVSNLAERQQRELTQAMTVAAGAAWDRADNWTGTDLLPVVDMGDRMGADVQIADNAGRTVAASPGFSRAIGPMHKDAVVVRGQHVGTIAVRITGAGLAAEDNALRTALWWAIAGGSRGRGAARAAGGAGGVTADHAAGDSPDRGGAGDGPW
jgi:hypothetical protein